MDHAVSVFVVSPAGIPLVKDPRKENPLWKLPGGKREGNESSVMTGVREVTEEIGVSLDPDSLRLISRQDQGDHVKYTYLAILDSLPPLKERGDEGEYIAVFALEEL